jgi:hypothetical protein
MIEDSLEAIYAGRKSTLLARARKFKENQMNKKSQRDQNPVPRSAYMKDFDDYDEEDDEEDNDEAEYQKDALRSVRPPSVSSTAPPSFAPPAVEVLSEISKTARKGAGTGVDVKKAKAITTQAEASNSGGAGDQIALAAYETFCAELQEWIKDEKAVTHEDVRGDYCDHLIDKYLANSLDILDSSATISQVRKDISHAVEQFASEGTLPAGVLSYKLAVQEESKDKKGAAGAAVKGGKGAANTGAAAGKGGKKSVVFGQDPSDTKAKGTAPLAAKPSGSEAEKTKIRQQYEQFMKLKKKNEDHPDEAKIAECQNLNDDIQSLLSTLQKK